MGYQLALVPLITLPVDAQAGGLAFVILVISPLANVFTFIFGISLLTALYARYVQAPVV